MSTGLTPTENRSNIVTNSNSIKMFLKDIFTTVA